MLVDVVYPGYMPYKNLGIVEDLRGYIDVHRSVLGYDFDTFVGGTSTVWEPAPMSRLPSNS